MARRRLRRTERLERLAGVLAEDVHVDVLLLGLLMASHIVCINGRAGHTAATSERSVSVQWRRAVCIVSSREQVSE